MKHHVSDAMSSVKRPKKLEGLCVCMGENDCRCFRATDDGYTTRGTIDPTRISNRQIAVKRQALRTVRRPGGRRQILIKRKSTNAMDEVVPQQVRLKNRSEELRHCIVGRLHDLVKVVAMHGDVSAHETGQPMWRNMHLAILKHFELIGRIPEQARCREETKN
jgi:hypothetical protein